MTNKRKRRIDETQLSEEERAELLEKRKKAREAQRARRARRKAEKWAKLKEQADPETGIVVGQLKMDRGHDGSVSTKHGFYRKKLDAKEAEIAEEIHQTFRDTYELDGVADDILLHTAVVNIVKSLRKEPKNKSGDNNVRSYQAFYEREVRQILDSLALTPKTRKDGGHKDNLAREIGKLFSNHRLEEEEGEGVDSEEAT